MDGMAWQRECQVKGASTGETEVREGADSSLGHWPGLQPFVPAALCTNKTHVARSHETQVSSCLQLCDLGQVIWPLWALVFSHSTWK